MRFTVPSWEGFDAGAEAAEEIAASLGVPLEKKDPLILSTPGYQQVVRAFLRAIGGSTKSADRAAVQEAARKLDRNWEGMSAAERDRVIASAAKSFIGVPELVLGKVTKSLVSHMTEVVRITKRDTGKTWRLNISPSFTARDEKIIAAAAKSQGNYITDRYSNRAESFSQKCREIVTKGLGDGLGRQDIGKLLSEQVIGPELRVGESYWETIAAIHTTRARSWGQLSGFEEAGISEYQWESVLDEVTSNQCRFLHGRTFSVAKAVAAFEAVEDAGPGKDIEKLQPWMRVGRTDDGGQFLFVDRGNGSRKMVARVESSGVGVADKTGTFSGDIGVAAMQKLGVGTPPVHPRCRSTIVPA